MSTVNLQRRKSGSNISMRDWSENKVSVSDIEHMIDLQDDYTEEYEEIHRKLETRLSTYHGPNPFVHVLPFTHYEWFKLFLFTITGMIFIKMLLFLLFLVLTWIGAVIKNCCFGEGYSWKFGLYVRSMARVGLHIMGFHWISIKFEKGHKPKKWPKIITPNHITFFDALILYYYTGAVFVAKEELRSVPFLGSIMVAVGSVFVDRSTKSARREVINVIKRHCEKASNPPLCIFPQGTNSNTLTLTQFKPGAFIPGVTCQPTAIHYTNCLCDMAMFNGLFFEGIHAATQFINFVRVEFLAPYRPSEEEKEDPLLYASNVRVIVAEALCAQLTPHTFDDLLLSTFAEELRAKQEVNGIGMLEQAPFVMDDVHRKLKMKTKNVIKLAKIYMRHCDDRGVITLDTFCTVFHIKDNQFAQTLFELIIGARNHETVSEIGLNQHQRVKDRFITFDDFLVGVAICYQEEHEDDALTLFFCMMDRDDDGDITARDVLEFVRLVQEDAGDFDGDMTKFCGDVFRVEEWGDDKAIDWEQFRDTVQTQKQTKIIQQFLQFMMFSFLGVCLDEDMMVVTK